MKRRKFFFAMMILSVVLLTQNNFRAQTIDDYVTLTIHEVGNGSGLVVSSPPGIDCGDRFNKCSAQFPRATPVTLSPRALHGPSFFHGWSVAVGSTSPCVAVRGECHFILMEDSTARAVFVVN